MIARVCTLFFLFTYSINVLSADPDCKSPLETGYCKGMITRYGFNPKTKKCEKFIYGGCGGNKNKYKTFEECQEACEPDCSLPLDPGPCKANIPVYGCKTSGKCEQFIYGGCQGNRNRYKTLEECRKKCP